MAIPSQLIFLPAPVRTFILARILAPNPNPSFDQNKNSPSIRVLISLPDLTSLHFSPTLPTSFLPHLLHFRSSRSMALATRMMRLPASSTGLRTIAQRSYATSNRALLSSARPTARANVSKSTVSHIAQRTYADVAPVDVKKPSKFRFLRWGWRLTYLSLLAGTAYLGYEVWELRHPDEQFQPDPTKKNLVILGTHNTCLQFPYG